MAQGYLWGGTGSRRGRKNSEVFVARSRNLVEDDVLKGEVKRPNSNTSEQARLPDINLRAQRAKKKPTKWAFFSRVLYKTVVRNKFRERHGPCFMTLKVSYAMFEMNTSFIVQTFN